MEYKIYYKKFAEKYLDGQSKSNQMRIMDAVDKLPDGDIIKLKGRDGYRLTVGGFRVLFDIKEEAAEEGKRIIEIVAIGSRGDVYKKIGSEPPCA